MTVIAFHPGDVLIAMDTPRDPVDPTDDSPDAWLRSDAADNAIDRALATPVPVLIAGKPYELTLLSAFDESGAVGAVGALEKLASTAYSAGYAAGHARGFHNGYTVRDVLPEPDYYPPFVD